MRSFAARLRLSVDPRRRRQGAGARLGQGPGASLEFHDHRPYAPGDDLRHLDWGVYARTDHLVLRRHRVEVAPRIDLVLDCSQSMALLPAKFALGRSLAELLCLLAGEAGCPPQLWFASDSMQRAGRDWPQRLRSLGAAGSAGLAARGAAFSAGSDRLLISDGLDPQGGAALVRSLGAGAGSIALIQILSDAECDPVASGPAHLVDVEAPQGEGTDIVLDAAAIAAYRRRLAQHQHGWQTALAGRGPGLITCRAEAGLSAAVRALLAAGVVSAR